VVVVAAVSLGDRSLRWMTMLFDLLSLLGYHALSMKHDKPTEDAVTVTEERRQFDLPELLHNLDLLVEMAESEVIQNDKKYETIVLACLLHK